MSAPNESDVRAVIRDTWLRLSQKGPSVVQHRFPIGGKGLSESMRQQLEEEQKTYGDVAIIENLEETYSNLALKTLRTMEYAYQNFRFQYILKVDSDSFVRLGAFIKSLKDIQHPRLYWGFLDGRAKPFRKGKWREADWMLCDRYLPYQLNHRVLCEKEYRTRYSYVYDWTALPSQCCQRLNGTNIP
ncbi:N-acetyllactosaminide 3-alpha-galactosyltransferase, partial [Ostertagia ostertagi]